jgi:hypothetical protein
MTIPYVPIKIDPAMSLDAFAMYLEFSILWHKDIRDGAFNDFDRRWKQGQMDLLQSMVDEIDGIQGPSWIDTAFSIAEEMENE